MNSQQSKVITGVGSGLWDKSKSCGQCLEIENKSVVIIGDYCPPPCTPYQLDLNQYTSSILNPKEFKPKNYINLRARRILCEWSREPELYLDKGSSEYNWYIIPLYVKQPFKSLTLFEQEAYHDLYGRWVFSFKKKFPKRQSTYLILIDKLFYLKINF
ncbi:MAG: hypothetical protein EBS55_09445 [Flavobacteriaceae bacterium]|nr:hypothetical protein [Flavobacteriaceae bacterium]